MGILNQNPIEVFQKEATFERKFKKNRKCLPAKRKRLINFERQKRYIQILSRQCGTRLRKKSSDVKSKSDEYFNINSEYIAKTGWLRAIDKISFQDLSLKKFLKEIDKMNYVFIW